MKKSLLDKIKISINDNHPGLYLILCTIKRVLKKDDEYVRRVFYLDTDPDYIKIEQNGNRNEGRIFFIIRDQDRSVGFCAEIMDVLRRLIYAYERGFYPIILFSDNFLYYDEDKNDEIKNPFDYYFEPVGSVSDIESAYVINSGRFHADYIEKKYKLDAYLYDHYFVEFLKTKCSVVVNKYLRIKKEISDECVKYLLGNGDNKKILGVHYRGTDYKVGYNLHPKQVKEEQTISIIRKLINEKGYEAVFLATDDKKMCDTLKKELSVKVFFYDDVYRSDGNVSVAFSEDNRNQHHYKLGYEILRDMYSLSLCEGLVAGKSNVSYLANIYKISRDEQYEDLIIIDNGMNTNDNNFYDSVKELKNLK